MDSNSHYEGNHSSKSVGEGFEIYPADLNIIWGKDARYWKLPEGESPAELIQVSWLEVTGWCDKVEAGTAYEVKFEVKLTPDAFGFNELPIYFMVKSGKQSIWKKIYLTKATKVESNGSYRVPNSLTIKIPDSGSENKLFFGLYEVWSGKWKGGLIIQKVLIEKKQQD